MIRPILTHLDPRLRQKSLPVTDFTPDAIEPIVEDLIDTLIASNGVGISAIQVGVALRVIAVMPDPRGIAVSYVNPRILARSPMKVAREEGCLSVPGEVRRVRRSAWVVFEAHGLSGVVQKHRAEGLRAVIVQHEIDHLDGVLMIDAIRRR